MTGTTVATDYFELMQDITTRHIGTTCKPKRVMGYCKEHGYVEADPIDVVMGTVPSCTECGEFLENCDERNEESCN